jgi:hypothetical protein
VFIPVCQLVNSALPLTPAVVSKAPEAKPTIPLYAPLKNNYYMPIGIEELTYSGLVCDTAWLGCSEQTPRTGDKATPALRGDEGWEVLYMVNTLVSCGKVLAYAKESAAVDIPLHETDSEALECCKSACLRLLDNLPGV